MPAAGNDGTQISGRVLELSQDFVCRVRDRPCSSTGRSNRSSGELDAPVAPKRSNDRVVEVVAGAFESWGRRLSRARGVLPQPFEESIDGVGREAPISSTSSAVSTGRPPCRSMQARTSSGRKCERAARRCADLRGPWGDDRSAGGSRCADGPAPWSWPRKEAGAPPRSPRRRWSPCRRGSFRRRVDHVNGVPLQSLGGVDGGKEPASPRRAAVGPPDRWWTRGDRGRAPRETPTATNGTQRSTRAARCRATSPPAPRIS